MTSTPRGTGGGGGKQVWYFELLGQAQQRKRATLMGMQHARWRIVLLRLRGDVANWPL